MLHVKLKLAPPEQCNTLHLMTTTCAEMTAERTPIPINPYFPLYSPHLLSFLPAEASLPSQTRAGFILLCGRRREGKTREQIFLNGEKKSLEWERKRWWWTSRTETSGCLICHLNCFIVLTVLFTKKSVYTERDTAKSRFSDCFLLFEWSIQGLSCNINTNTTLMLRFDTNTAIH